LRYRLVVVGTSLGGLRALEEIFSGLPGNFPLPIAVVQHRSVESDRVFLEILQSKTRLRIKEIDDKDEIKCGYIYISPPNYHVLAGDGVFHLSVDETVLYARPSIDVLFESAARSYKSSLIGVLLTGASRDGANGLAMIKRSGGLTIVQEPATAEGKVMPQAGIEATKVDYIVPLREVKTLLMELTESQEEGQ
jgi:two-component system, chemotaxis family, protein-glutamate methylesterase/glutaminase